MLAASHAITGAYLAAHAPTPLSGYLLAFLSHPLLDLIPHWDFNSRHNGRSPIQTIAISLTDAGVGFAIGYFLFRGVIPLSQLFLTMFIAQLPDWIEAPYHILKWDFPPFSWIKQAQHLIHNKLKSPWGIFTQLAFLLLLFLL